MISRALNAFALSLFLLIGLGPAYAQTLQPAPAARYVREDLASQLVRLEDSLKREGAGLSSQPSDTLRRNSDAILARNPREAMRLAIGAIAADSRNALAWLSFSKAASNVDSGNNYSERYELRNRALTAAYGYYARANGRPQEAAALANLADMFASREQSRAALDTYKASLALADSAPVRAAYQTLRETKGFRMTDYKVDADGAIPRICFEFSEPLARGRVDFAPYVAVSGVSNPAVNAEGSQLCVEGLKHGERYTVALRQGLPSSVDEALLKTVDQDIYIKDRSAQVRFSGKNYVLPRTGQEGVPVISVNTTEVFIDVYRIGDRSLLPTVRSDEFLTNLSRSSAEDIEKQKGVKVWSGTLATQRDLNRDVTTAFPVLEAVKSLEPGVYVMTGRAEKKARASDNDYDGDNSVATQWFIVSDLGLTAFSGEDGVHVIVRSLASAEPVAGVEVRLVAKNNEILGVRPTDARGIVKFDPGLARGTGGMSPGLVTATINGDYGFLDLASTAFDLSDRGVKGRAAPGPLDSFLFTERGVYRGGESVQVTALLRDAQGRAPRNLPLTLIAKRPDGVEYKRAVLQDQGLGGRAYSLPLISGAQRGTWRLEIYADPKADALGDTTFLVEDYVPERIELKLTPKKSPIGGDEPAVVDVDARYLYGAPGSDLQVSGEILVRKATKNPIPGMDGFSYGVDDENFENVNKEIEEGPQTDAQGRATVSADLPEFETTRPVEARVTLRVGESGGRAVERSVVIPVAPKGPVIAVKKLFDDTSIGDGANAEFEVALVNPDGTRLARQGLQWTLYRVTRSYQWYNKDGRWGYEPIKTTRRISDGRVDASATSLGKISAAVNWGWYRLEVGSGASTTSVTFYAGWSGEPKTDTPDLLDVSLDKDSYNSGDRMKLTLRPGFAGKATIGIVGDKVYDWQVIDVAANGTTIELDAKAEWGAGAYIVAMAHRPLDQAAKRMPGRALGLAWFSVDKASRKLTVDVTPEKIIKPRGTLDIPIRLAGLTAGEEAYVTVSAVDLGILNLTRYETPDPFDYFFGQRQLSAEIRDLYGLLIDGMQGTRGAIRSGGDASANSGENSPPRDAPLVRYSGVVKVGADGTAKISFDIPAFNGAARVAVHAWSKDKVASATTDVIIRDPVVLLGTLPRFMSVGDRSRLHLAIDNVEGPAGDYVLDVDLRGPVGASSDSLRRTLRLGAKQKAEASLAISASDVGTATVAFRLTGPGGIDLTQAMTLNVAPGSVGLVRRTVRALPPQSSLTISSDLTADLLPSSASVSVSVSPYGALDVPSLLAALDRYPYGCTEQTVSRAMPLLYVNRLASQEALALDAKADDRVRESIDRVLARQDSNGAFGLWSVGGNDIWLDAFVTDFLTRARERNFTVPQLAFDLALDRLRNHVASAEVEKGKGQDLAYAIYVLARNGRPVIGDLRYLVDTKLSDFGSPLARAQLGAALGLLGDRARAQKAFGSALEMLRATRDNGFSREDYGSRLRDGAGVITLASESGADRAQILQASTVVSEAREASRYTSTQEQAWMVLAAQAMAADSAQLALTVDGAQHTGAFYKTWRGLALDTKPIAIANTSNVTAQMVVSTSGNPLTPEPAVSQGYVVERSYYRQDGTAINLAQPVKQNDRMVVVLKVTEQRATFARLLLVDMLPAGFEIDNPNLVDSGQVGALSWLKRTIEPANTEYRDDRFVAAFDRAPNQQATFTIAYMVRAVSPGRYVHPPALVEDMYRPDRFGRTAFGVVDVTPARP